MIRLSKKMLFAIEAVLDIAYNGGANPVRSAEITARQGIPRRYLEPVLHGLTLGAMYAMVAAGLALMLGVARLINFAHGEFFMLGAYAFWLGYSELGLSYPVAALLALYAAYQLAPTGLFTVQGRANRPAPAATSPAVYPIRDVRSAPRSLRYADWLPARIGTGKLALALAAALLLSLFVQLWLDPAPAPPLFTRPPSLVPPPCAPRPPAGPAAPLHKLGARLLDRVLAAAGRQR